jgi:predicted O-linked N-acetylglucosamine transferase (SPINDLY family)
VKAGRNDPCPCGSGKKYKKCCGQEGVAAAPGNSARKQILTPEDTNLLIALFNAGHYADLESNARALLEQLPNSGFVWKVLGLSLKMQGKDALQAMQKAAKLLPNDAEAHSNLGNALNELGQFEDAVASFRRALALKPDYAEAHSNLGNALKDLGQFDAAVASYGRALKLKPDLPEVHYNLGNALQALKKSDDAVASYRRALALRPDYADAYSNLGISLQELGQLEDAAASYRKALTFPSEFAEVQHLNLGNTLKDLGRIDEATASYRRALTVKPDFVEAHSSLLFTQNYRHDRSAVDLLADARRFGDLVAAQAPAHQAWQNAPEPEKCLRVGLVSGDLRNHPVGFFLQGVLAALASQSAGRLQLVAYTTQSGSDALTERIRNCCHGWHSAVGLSDERLAQKIRDDGIDILLDLSGHTAHNRLPMFARKPAPVQASWLGYFATTGVAAIDYLIADPWTLPQTEEIYFTEKIWRLPETRLCFTPPEVDLDLDVSPLPALANGYVTFGCFNNLAKMNDQVVAVWAKVLQSTPHSKLFLKAAQLNEVSMQQNTVARFVAHGIDPARLMIEGAEPREKYLAAYGRVDIALDPFPYPGGTTTVEGLWMGVPAVTLAGTCFLARQGVGILMNAGLAEWIASDADDYVARTVLHAADLPRLSALRERLRQQALASPLFDAPRFARHFEAALRGMWFRWCEGGNV